MRSLRCFTRNEKGAVTVEFTVLFPFFIFLMIFFADAAVIYLTHSEMYNVARDVARRMSTGELESTDEVVNYASAHLFLGNRSYSVATSFGGDVGVEVSVPMGGAMFFGMFFRPILGDVLVARARVNREPRLVGE